MTRPPAASMRAAAAITSITMNGGTSLRPEGAINRLAASNIVSRSLPRRPRLPPRCRRISADSLRDKRSQSGVIATALTVLGRTTSVPIP
jgi:hypothetical protein